MHHKSFILLSILISLN